MDERIQELAARISAQKKNPLGALERELQAEKASAIGRIGRKLEALLDELGALRRAIDSATGEERRAQVERYRAVRQDAETWRWYYLVQREAMGLRDHSTVEDWIALPARIE